MSRRRTHAPAALLGIAGVVLLALAPLAGAGGAPVEGPPVYSAAGRAAGVELDVGLRPSIFPSLVQVGIPYVRNDTSSIAGGSTTVLASQLFPGDLATGGAGCGGLPGSVQAKYPPDGCLDDENEGTAGLRSPPSGEGIVTVAQGRMRALAGRARADGLVTTQRVSLRTSPEAEPIGEVLQLRAQTVAEPRGASIAQTAETSAQAVVVEAGSVRIVVDSVVSRATATTDGVSATAEAILTIGDVTVTFGDASASARIDSRGVHIAGPMPSSVRERLDARLQQELASAGIDVRLARPVEITDGARAEASVGGLVIRVGATIPSAPVPAAVAQVVSTILDALDPQLTRNRCVHEIDPSLPGAALCLGLGIVPGPGTAVVDTITVGGVSASAIGGLGYTAASFGGDDVPDEPAHQSGEAVANQQPAPPPGGFAAPPAPPPVTTPPQGGDPAPLFGLVSEMPHTLLLVLGIACLLLATGVGVAPALRRR